MPSAAPNARPMAVRVQKRLRRDTKKAPANPGDAPIKKEKKNVANRRNGPCLPKKHGAWRPRAPEGRGYGTREMTRRRRP